MYFCKQTDSLSRFFIILFLLLGINFYSNAQDSIVRPETTKTMLRKDTPSPILKKGSVKVDTQARVQKAFMPSKVDSLVKRDSIALAKALVDSLQKDSLQRETARKALPFKDTSTYSFIAGISYLPMREPPVFRIDKEHEPLKEEGLFYVLTGAICFMGAIKVLSPRYFKNLFNIFFQTSFRQKQTRDQLLQDNWPSLFMNLLFIISGSIYTTLIIQRENWLNIHFYFWWILAYCAAILVIIYLSKYLFLRFFGWVFNENDAIQTYIFVVFLSNKVIGVLLLPFLLILAFSGGKLAEVCLIVSVAILIAMLVYRYLVSLGTIRSTLKVSGLHFFLYLCTIEILPLLIIYKAFFNYIATGV